MTSEQVKALQGKAGAAMALGEKVAATFHFAEPRMLITRALMQWGLGRLSAAAAAEVLSRAVESARRQNTKFEEGKFDLSLSVCVRDAEGWVETSNLPSRTNSACPPLSRDHAPQAGRRK